jgi:hypothetical protein
MLKKSLVLTVALLALAIGVFGTGCQKESVGPTSPAIAEESGDPAGSTPVIAVQAAATPTITATVISSRSLSPRGVFQFQVKLTQGTTPMANAVVGVEDPIVQMCKIGTTNAAGICTYSSASTSSTPAGIYTYLFRYGTASITSTVSVLGSGVTMMPTFKVDLLDTKTVSANTLVAGIRTPGENLSPAGQSGVNSLVSLGLDIAKTYLANPVNVGMLAFTVTTCTIAQTVPGVGQAACAVGVKFVVGSVTTATAKTLAKRMVDASTNLTATEKTQAKAAIDISTSVFSILTSDPSAGFITPGTVSSAWTFGTASTSLLKSGTSVTGGSIAAPVNGSSKLLQVSFRSR